MGDSFIIKNPAMVQCKIQVSSVETRLVLGGGVKSELRRQIDKDPLNSVRHVVQYSKGIPKTHIPHVKQDLALHPAGGLVAVQHAENLPVGDDGQLLLDPALGALAPLLEVALECWSVAPLDQLLRVYCSHNLATLPLLRTWQPIMSSPEVNVDDQNTYASNFSSQSRSSS